MEGEVICDLCRNPAELKTGKDIYPHRPDLSDLRIWKCSPCNASVGCHKGTIKPLGTFATPEIKEARMAAHAAFDPIWKDKVKGRVSKSQARKKAYKWLAHDLSIPFEKCHIGMMGIDLCARVVESCKRKETCV